MNFSKFLMCALMLCVLPTVYAEEKQTSLPVVKAAETPLYPPLARAARIEGTVIVEVTTNGESVTAAHSTSGHKLLQDAAQQNLKAWRFYPHKPMTFTVCFVYSISKGQEVEGWSNSKVILEFPTRVEVQTTPPKIETQVSY